MKKIAVLFSTRNRLNYTRESLERLIDSQGVDIYWFDGSDEPESRQFATVVAESTLIVKHLQHGVTGGPDVAIIRALSYKAWDDYQWVVLVENDIVFRRGWVAAMQDAVDAAMQDGYEVQAATVRVYADRILHASSSYNLMFNSGAGMIALRPSAVERILQVYRTCTFGELRRDFFRIANVDIARQFGPRRSDNTPASADWFFDAVLYRAGGAVVAPVCSWCEDIDEKHHARLSHLLVRSQSDRPDYLFNKIVDPLPINGACFDSICQFQRSPNGSGYLVPIQRLAIDSASKSQATVHFEGDWGIYWNQLLGPFGLIGSGVLEIQTLSDNLRFLVNFNSKISRDKNSLNNITGVRSGTRLSENYALLDVPQKNILGDKVRVEFFGGSPGLIGLVMPSDILTAYTNNIPVNEFLDVFPLA